jgi:hypothetical protein
VTAVDCDISLVTIPAFELAADEYEALTFAAGMLDVRAELFAVDGLHGLAKATRDQAETLRRLHDRWHLSRVRSAGLEDEHTECGWCRNALAVTP